MNQEKLDSLHLGAGKRKLCCMLESEGFPARTGGKGPGEDGKEEPREEILIFLN